MDFPAIPASTPEDARAMIESFKEQKELERAKQAEEIKSDFMQLIAKQGKWLHDVAENGVEAFTSKGESYKKDGRQYIFENAARLKDMAATAQLLTTGSDGSGSPITLALVGRTGEKPVKEMDAEVTEVTRVIE